MANKPNIVKAIGNQLGTTLASGINASDTSITVSDGAGFSSDGGYIIIDENVAGKEEIVYVESASGATLTIATDGRGRAGTSASVHDAGATVSDILVDEHINGIAEEFRIEHDDNGGHTGLDNGIVLSGSAVSTSNKVVDASGDNTVSGTALSSTNLVVDQAGDYHSMARQAVMNGNFDVWQRGTSFSIVDVTSTYSADRWREYASDAGGTLPTLTRSRQALTTGDIPGSFYFTRLATNGAGTSLGANAFHGLYHAIEHGVRYLCGDAKKVTVSFYARSSIANKKLGVFLSQSYGTGGTPTSREDLTGTTWTLTSDWVKYEHTFTTNTLVGKTFGTNNDDFLQLVFWHMWGTTYGALVGETTAETYVGSGNIDIAQVQLCAGEVALPFEPKGYRDELAACMRYFQTTFTVGPVTAADSYEICYPPTATYGTLGNNVYIGYVRYRVPIRTASTPVTYPYTTVANTGRCSDNNGTDFGANSAAVANQSIYGFRVYNTSGGSLTLITNQVIFHWSVNADFY